MVLGYCPTCDRLVPIRPGSQHWGSRSRDWVPQPHDDGERLCSNTKPIR